MCKADVTVLRALNGALTIPGYERRHPDLSGCRVAEKPTLFDASLLDLKSRSERLDFYGLA
jgi:hypothetical protein